MSFLKSMAIGLGRSIAITAVTTVVIVGILWWMVNRKPNIPDGTTLVVQLDKPLVEAELPVPPMLALFGGNSSARIAPVHDIANSIRAAAADPRIARLLVNLDGFSPSGMQTVAELRDALVAFKASKKPMIVYAPNFGRSHYLLASAADHRWIDPMGHVDLSGPDFSTPYISDLLTKAGIEIHVAKAGTFKSAVEPYILPNMSPQARAQYTTILSGFRDSFFQTAFADPATAKSQQTDGGSTAEQALAQRIVTKLASPYELDQATAPRFPSTGKRAIDAMVPVEIYRRAVSAPSCASDKKIAVLTLSGPIGMQGDPLSTITPSSTIEVLRRVANSGNAGAIVLRIDSPGGDAQAAEMIRAEIAAVRKSGIPVIASLSNAAASGGYWIATAANEIVAGEFTMTGSIGAFAIRPSVEQLARKFYVNPQTVRVGPEPLNTSMMEPLTNAQRKRLDTEIHSVYDRFLTVVSQSRNIPLDALPAIAEGRVWTGPQALDLKLVDKIGNLDSAVARAAAIAKVSPDCRANVYPHVTMEQIMNSMARGYSFAALPSALADVIKPAQNQIEFITANTGRALVYCIGCEGVKP